jgi:germination protein M
MKIFRVVTFLVILFGLAGLVGCQPQIQPVPEPVPSDPQVIQTMNVAVYYLKDKNNEMYLVREVHKVEKSVEVAQAALHELISGNPLTSGAIKVLPTDTKILGIKIENGLATVDFSGEVLKANVGSTGEALGIASIVNTLTEFPTVQQVQFTVDGKAENGLGWWGHVGLYEQPFKRNLSSVYEPVIWVIAPIADQTITSPVRIKGNARIFEAMVSYLLRDANGNILAQGSTMATAGAPDRGDFEAQLSFTPASVGKGQLEVYEESMKDGSEMNMVIIPVQWQSK